MDVTQRSALSSSPLSSLLRDILATVAWKIRVSRFLMHLGCQAEHMVKQSVEILSRKLSTPRWYIGAKAINWLFNSYILVIHLRYHRKCRKGKFDFDQNIEDSSSENEGAAKGACNYRPSLPLIWKIVMLIHGIPVCCLIWTGRWSKTSNPRHPWKNLPTPPPVN